MTCINWLHITDLHIREKPAKDDNLYHVIKGSFLDDLKFLHDSCGPWDLLFLTGDLVFSGTEAQFKQADELLDKLLDELHVLGARPQVLAVPGNHDLERPEKALAAQLMQWDKEVRDSFFEKRKSTYREMVKTAFQNYQAWWEKRGPKDATSLSLPGEFMYRFKKDGMQLGIVGLNTGFLHVDDAKQGTLAVAPPNVDIGEWAKENHASIVLTHHPPDWLKEREYFSATFNPKQFAAHFYGHMHEPDSRFTREAGGRPRREFQGYSLFSNELISETQRKRLHGYSAGRLEFSQDAAELSIWPRHAVPHGGTWTFVPDFQHYEMDEKEPESNCVGPERVDLNTPFSLSAAPVSKRQEARTPLPFTLHVTKEHTVSLTVDGQTVSGTVDYDDPVQKVIRPLIDSLSSNKIDNNGIELLGKFLFRALFNGKIREKFEEHRKPNGRHIRIQLQFADEDLASLPWEYMFYYRERTPGYYLSEKVDLTLSRFMPPPMDLQEAEELRLLLVFSKTDENGFDNDVADKLFDALDIRDKSITPDVRGDYCCVSFDGRVKITICQQPTYSRLSKYLSDANTPFHIVHFVGQGSSDDDLEHQIALGGEWRNEGDFVRLFDQGVEIVPKLVFLQLYENEKRQEKRVALLAQHLITVGVRFVVGMQHWMSSQAAGMFANAFYRRLAYGDLVDTAVQAGRSATYTEVGGRSFGTPVVYLCCDSPLIRRKTQDRTEDEKHLEESAWSSQKSAAAGVGMGVRSAPTKESGRPPEPAKTSDGGPRP